MLKTAHGRGGAVTAPHHLASEAGLQVLKDGGAAAEAAVAIAATLAVVYPHMNSIGGDSFWLLAEPGRDPVGVDACGRAAAAADLDLYRRAGLSAVPWRGPLAANTVAGTLSGWSEVLRLGGGRLPLARLLEPAIGHAEQGCPVTRSMAQLTAAKRAELGPAPGFAQAFLPGGELPILGQLLRQPALGATLRALAAEGLDSAYRGRLARTIAADLAAAGSPVALADLEAHHAAVVQPLSVGIGAGRLYNMPPPTQGLASLMILALFDRLGVREGEGFAHVHGLVEATKRAFRIRDRHVGDPALMSVDAQGLLGDQALLDRLAGEIDPARALAWPQPPSDGDTVWFGAIDGQGRAVSAIQSIYFEFGSGVVLPQTGITWQNRGASFRIAEDGWNALRPGRKPFHTLNPAMARLGDGRTMAYGTMGGEGQPQTQAAVFTRYAVFGQDLQDAITAPRWLLGRTWGEQSTSLKLEDRFDPALVEALRAAGHVVDMLEPFTSVMGHAGALVRHADGALDGATDPRSDGAALAY
ncbi:MAG: gamma-glutamyltransferase [Caulobacteraceae bacterium]|nr:gamma-glutamyltransferase [Caulobacteraceae bacterium]